MFLAVVSELELRKILNPLRLVVCHKLPQNVLDRSVGSFRLAIGFWMSRSRHPEGNLAPCHELLPQFAGESGISVRYDRFWHSVIAADVVDEKFDDSWGVISGGAGDKMCHLGQSVDHCHDCIMTVRLYR